MAKAKRVTTTAGQFVRQFSHYSDVALAQPVVVTRNGRARNVVISVENFEEYERLKRQRPRAFKAEDAPDELVADLENFLRRRKR